MTDDATFFRYQPSSANKNEGQKLVTVVSLRSEKNLGNDRSFWLARKLAGEEFELQELNDHDVPAGPSQRVSADEFASDYTLELDYWQQKVRKALEKQDGRLQRGEAHREQGEFYSAEMEYAEALAVDENNVRATFGLGLTYLAKGDTEKAQEVFAKVLDMKAAFTAEHKHMFNDFGISMRKNGMYKEALKYYSRGVELDSTDENLFFNIARTHFESGDWQNCFRYLTMCLEKNRGVKEAVKFCNYLIRRTEKDNGMLREMSAGDNGDTLRSNILNLLRQMQVAAGIELEDAIEKTHEIRDRMIAIEEEDMQMEEIEKDLYNLDGL
ncbi:tetratricopeptide repeat protein [Maridesulfovibrio sp. FT414]|uniref:tetratricopeptide repeat protein n=1 Tax=Maridesulfovibrio sp. FT414 TaxID=2979469 RepID=UPI003D8013C1